MIDIWANCDNCKHYATGDERCHECLATRPPSKWEAGANYEPPTNADRIRAMSDEELSEMLTIGTGAFDCGECRDNKATCEGGCVEQCLAWLQQPAKGE